MTEIKLPPLPDPDAYLFQHEETGLTQYVGSQQVERGFEKANPRWQKICGAFTERQLKAYATAAYQAALASPEVQALRTELEADNRRLRDALQSRDREDVKRPVLDSIVDEIHRRTDKEWADDGYDFEVTITADEYKALCEEEKAIDHARRIEGDGK